MAWRGHPEESLVTTSTISSTGEASPFKHGPLPGSLGLLADLTLGTFSFVTRPDDRLGSSLSSCRAGFVLAKELRRICESSVVVPTSQHTARCSCSMLSRTRLHQVGESYWFR